MRQIAWLLACSSLAATGCLEVDPPPPPVVGAALSGRVLVVGSQGEGTAEAGQAMRRGRRAFGLLEDGARVKAEDLKGTEGFARLAPKGHRLGGEARGQKQPMRWKAGEVIALFDARDRFTPEALVVAAEEMLARAGFAEVRPGVRECTMRLFCVVTLEGPGGKPLDEAATQEVALALHARRAPGVKVIARNFYKSAFRVPSDPFFSFQWHYEFARLTAAWDITTGDPDLVIAVVDSGLNLTHPDIATRVVQGADVISDPGVAGDGNGRDPDPTDPGDGARGNGQSSWHGTHVAGTLAAETDDGEGVAGVTWQGRIQPVRVLGLGAQGLDSDILAGLAWAVGDPGVQGVPPNTTRAKVVNLSLGGPADAQGQQVWSEVVDIITNREGANYGYPILVTAAGNSNESVENIVPANIPAMITVGASRVDGRRAEYSNWGPSIDVMGPGGQSSVDQNVDGFPDGVLSLYANEYDFEQGTSMAAPHVSGVIALALSIDPTLDQARAQQLIRLSADPAGVCNEGCGTGYLDAAAALIAAGGAIAPEPTLAVDVTRVIFQAGQAQQGFRVLNIGQGDLAWTSEITGPQAALFSLSPPSGVVSSQGASPVTVALTRGEYAAGSANLLFSSQGTAEPQLVRVDLSFNDAPVPVQTNLQVIQVAVFRVLENGELAPAGEPFLARRADGFTWRIEELEPGDYFVFAVGDDNNDGTFDANRESFGAWPVGSNPTVIAVEANTNYEGVNFGLSGGFALEGEGGVGAPCTSSLDCTFAADAECVTDWPGGYCSRICDDGYCGAGAACEELDCGGPCNICLLACSSLNQCRGDEGFLCDPFGTCTPSGF